MNEPICKYFYLGSIRWMSHPRRPLLESIRDFARDADFDAIEITHFDDEESRNEAKRLLEQSHMKVCYSAVPRLLGGNLNPNAIDEAARIEAEQILLDSVDEAKFLGAKTIGFLAGKWREETKEQAYKQLLKTTLNVCNYAAERDMGVDLEVFDYDVDKAALIGPAPLAARFAADMRCRCSNFGLMVDLSHIPATHETSRFVIRTLRPYIRHFHIGNAVVKPGCEAYGDLHPRFGFPNSANDVSELTEFFRVLKEEGFLNAEAPYVLSFEVKPWGDENEDIVLANAKRVLRRAWALA